MRLYLSAVPERMAAAERCGLVPAYLAYRAGAGGRLLIRNGGGIFSGGLMVLTDAAFPRLSESEAETLAGEICSECAGRGFSGAAADFEAPPDEGRLALLRLLRASLAREGKRLYVTEPYGESVPEAVVLVCTAVSGGTLRYRLCGALRKFGQDRVAADFARASMDFSLPSPGGVGRPVSGREREALTRQLSPGVFYSPELGAKYFTYEKQGAPRLLLFDDAETMGDKLRFAGTAGISEGFLQYGETADLLPAMFPAKAP